MDYIAAFTAIDFGIAVGFAVFWALLFILHSLEHRDRRERRREAHVRRLERECGLDEYPWGRAWR